MNLDLFNFIERTLDLYETKKGIYKLIAEELSEYFEDTFASGSNGELSVQYRIKSTESTREKIVRNNFVRLYNNSDDVLRNMRDLIGIRLECMFIREEKEIFKRIQSVFTKTEDGVYYFDPFMPKIRLKISERQPQKQKNGFDIYKIDGVFLLGKESVLFELQIKSMVNNFWGEIEHKIVYKNSAYVLADKYVTDLMISVKDGLNMIDSQLAILYDQFKISNNKDENNTLTQMYMFLSKMVHDTFAELMMDQIGFIINFRESCDTLVAYILNRGSASYENYGKTMMEILHLIRGSKENNTRLDEKLIFNGKLSSDDEFAQWITKTILSVSDLDYNWHLFCLLLFCLDNRDCGNLTKVEDYAIYFKQRIIEGSAFDELSQLDSETSETIKNDLLLSVAKIIDNKQNLSFICESGIRNINQMLTSFIPLILDNLGNGAEWNKIKKSFLDELQNNIE